MTAYYSSNIKKADASKVNDFLQEKKISALNTRLFKLADNVRFTI
jgi:hypothetical protein